MVKSYINSLYRKHRLIYLHMNNLDQIICNDYKLTHINCITRIKHSTLALFINHLGFT